MRKIILFTIVLFFALTGANGQALPKVAINTALGEIIVEIDTVHAPVTAFNFLKHVENSTYKNAVFYRVVRMDNQPDNKVKIEVIQGGLFDDEQIEKVVPIRHETTKETGLKHLNGTISMARVGPGTASTEFFICVGDQPELDFGGKRNPDGQGFAAFGKVLKGFDVVEKIQKQKDERQMLLAPVRILKVEVLR